jgi:hypothetical protein
MSVRQQPVLALYVYVVLPPAMPLDMSVLAACAVSSLQKFVMHLNILYKRTCAAPGHVCIKEPVLHLNTSVYYKRACAAPKHVCIKEPVLHLNTSV